MTVRVFGGHAVGRIAGLKIYHRAFTAAEAAASAKAKPPSSGPVAKAGTK